MKLRNVLVIIIVFIALGSALGLVKIMNPVKEANATESPKKKKIKYYRNPMDPSVHSDKFTKDSMGMDYIPVYEEEEVGSQVKEMGRGSFTLSPEQLKLSGSKITHVEKRDLIIEVRVPGRALGDTQVSFQVFEQDLSFIKSGMEFSAETPAAPGEILRGKVSLIDSILDPMTRTVRVDGTITHSDKIHLKTESSVIGKFEIKIPQALTIPRDSVIHVGSRDLIYVFDGKNGFSPREVMLGGMAQDWYEVKSGLREGEEISAGPNFLLDSESRIQFHD